MSGYVKNFYETKYMSFFDSKPVCNSKYLKDKIKSYEGKINTNFHKEGFHCTCLSVISTDFIVKMGKSYSLQVFLEKYKYIVKEKKISRFISDELDASSDDSEGNASDVFDEFDNFD